MLSLTTILFGIFAIIDQSSSHFLLNYPPTVGFDDSKETVSPCGGFTVAFSSDNVTDFHVGGDSIAVTSIHPQATWLFRATLDITAAGNYTNFLPTVQQSGLGDFCEPSLHLPAAWAGQKGVIQVVQDAPDGILYQCAAVNFVTGTGTPPTSCKNVTGLSATYSADPALSTLPASGTAASSGSATATGSSTTTTSAASTTKASGATGSLSTSELSSMLWVVGIGALAMAASLL